MIHNEFQLLNLRYIDVNRHIGPITDLRYHIRVDLADAYLRDNRSASFTKAVYLFIMKVVQKYT